ncbi:unnamed protein product [Mycena citricolor]|uniref:Uncharacterized protein n=1 Tax=Mycena citricolor TaxID=2018698 RepID=A0AAD2HF67_9AGAR|nr:unnamed protein product [Mycena citricolor]
MSQQAMPQSDGALTKRFRSSLRASSFTPTILRSIRAIESSRNTTISWSKNLMRHGLVPKCICGTRDFKRPTTLDSSGRLGRLAFRVMSKGPGTSTKCVDRNMDGRGTREECPCWDEP